MVILSAAAFTQAHGFGIGAQYNFIPESNIAQGVSLAFSPSHSFHIAGNWYLTKTVNTYGFTFDWRPLNLKIVDFGLATLKFNVDVGIYTNFMVKKDGLDSITGGARLPVGVNLMLLGDFLEVFTYVAPSIGARFNPSFALDEPFFPIAVGARVWLF